MSNPDQRVNLLTGWAVLAVVGIIAVVVGGVVLFSPATVPPRLFVAYFDDAGGVKSGDLVRAKGRRVGLVTDVAIMTHDGRPRVRVEFELRPGEATYEWLKQLPADTEIEAHAATIRSAAFLSLKPGKSTESVADGGELKKVKNDSGVEQLEQWRDALAKYDAYIDEARRALHGPLITDALAMIEGMRGSLDGISKSIAAGAARTQDIDPALRALNAGMVDLRKRIEDAKDTANRASAAGEAGSKSADAWAVDVEQRAVSIGASVEQVRQSVEQFAALLDTRGFAAQAGKLRADVARLRASIEMGANDPGLMGDLAPRRKARPFFFGDNFTPGNKLPDNDHP